MRRAIGSFLIAALWLAGPAGQAQTPQIQKEVNKKLEQLRADQQKKGEDTKLNQAKAGAAEQASLEQMIADALRSNPDIRVGESKVRDAEAELHRTRMKVLSDVTMLHAEAQAARAVAAEGTARLDRLVRLMQVSPHLVSSEAHAQAQQTLIKLKADLAVVQAKLSYLLGNASATTDPTGSTRVRLRWAAERLSVPLDAFQKNQKGVDPSKAAEALKGIPDKVTSDEEFLRRVMLDLFGRLPTVDETKEFMKRTDKERRDKLVEQFFRARPPGDNFQLELDVSPYLKRLAADDLATWLGAAVLARKPDSPLTDKLRKALDAPVRLEAQGLTPKDVLDHVRDTMLTGINLHVRASALKKTGALDIRLKESLPLGAFLQYLEDELEVAFVLRDYGIVVVGADERLPPGAISLIDFWKRGKAAEKASQAKVKK